MTALVPCPLCGGEQGYTLHEGITYRWWWVRCAECGSDLAECASDRRTTTGEPLPERWPSADQAWAEQGAHAQSLRADAARYRWLRTAGAWESEVTLGVLSEDPQKFDAAVDEAMKEAT